MPGRLRAGALWIGPELPSRGGKAFPAGPGLLRAPGRECTCPVQGVSVMWGGSRWGSQEGQDVRSSDTLLRALGSQGQILSRGSLDGLCVQEAWPVSAGLTCGLCGRLEAIAGVRCARRGQRRRKG